MAERLDVLFHAHDVQGLGHVSRGVAILGSLARMRPGSRLCLVSGCRFVDLSGAADVDWVKLPSYGSTVSGGVTHPGDGPSGLSLETTRDLRSHLLRELVATMRPRLVVVDHRPIGQHDELRGALQATAGAGAGTERPRWILGMRAVLGGVVGVWTEEAREIFTQHYSGMFWYGDRSVVGDGPPDALAEHFRTNPLELGYVSRAAFLAESGVIRQPAGPHDDAGVLSITWFSRETLDVLEAFLEAVRGGGMGVSRWRAFLGEGEEGPRKDRLLQALDASGRVERSPLSSAAAYLGSLAKARVAFVYAGYNSLLDVIWAGTPALAVTRQLDNREQSTHAAMVAARVPGLAVLPEEQVTPEALVKLGESLGAEPLVADAFPAAGATRAAEALVGLLDG